MDPPHLRRGIATYSSQNGESYNDDAGLGLLLDAGYRLLASGRWPVAAGLLAAGCAAAVGGGAGAGGLAHAALLLLPALVVVPAVHQAMELEGAHGEDEGDADGNGAQVWQATMIIAGYPLHYRVGADIGGSA